MRSAVLAATGLFILLASTAVAQGTGGGAGTTVQPKGPERLICRSVQEPGLIVRRTRRCYTRAQWDRLEENNGGAGSTAYGGGTSGN